METPKLFSLSQYLSELRDKRGWTQRELARKTGYSYSTIQRLESGETASPGVDVLISLAQALDVHVMRLILAYQGKDPAGGSDMDLAQALQSAIENVLEKREPSKDDL